MDRRATRILPRNTDKRRGYFKQSRKVVASFLPLLEIKQKGQARKPILFTMYRTHGCNCLGLLPSRSDPLHCPAIVLAFRQNLVYRTFLVDASLLPKFYFSTPFSFCVNSWLSALARALAAFFFARSWRKKSVNNCPHSAAKIPPST